MRTHGHLALSDFWQGHRARLLRILNLTAIFAVFGLAGLVFRPEYAGSVDILRGAGVAVAALVVFGLNLWPGIALGALLGGLLLNVGIPSGHEAPLLLLGTVAIAASTCLQAVASAVVIRRLLGYPLQLRSAGQIILAAVIAGPLCCMISSSVGTLVYYLETRIAAETALQTWYYWWYGDLLGVLVVVPLALFWPARHPPIVVWRGEPLPRLSFIGMLCVVASLCATLVLWGYVNRVSVDQNRRQFDILVEDNAIALIHRMEGYSFGLDSAAGTFTAERNVTKSDWAAFVTRLNLDKHLPGVNSMGFIQPVSPADLPAFLHQAQIDGVDNMTIKTDTPAPALFIVKYAEPFAANRNLIGLNIAFEKNRYEAAVAARDSGETRITSKISLVQDHSGSSGFLLLSPVYQPGKPLTTVEERRAAFIGWIYSPFIGDRLMENLTASQKTNLTISVYDGAVPDRAHLLYASQDVGADGFTPKYVVTHTYPIFGQTWTIVWTSTEAFELGLGKSGAQGVIFGGIAFTLLLAIFLLSSGRREERIRETVALRTRELAVQVNQNRSIIETAVAKIALLDGDGLVLRVNEATIRLFGYSRELVVGQPFTKLMSGRMTEYFARSSDPLDITGFRGEVDVYDRNGAALALDVQVNAWITDTGERRYTAVMRNISERRRIEHQLRETQRRLEIALTGANLGVFDIDLATDRSLVSGTWKSILGFDPSSQIDAQKEWRDRVHPEDLPRILAADAECIQGRSPRTVAEYRVRVVDGSWRWMRSDAVVGERDAAGKPVRLIGVLSDVTEMLQNKEDLRVSVEQFRSAIEDAPVGTALVNRNGRIIKGNTALTSLLGCEMEDLYASSIRKLVHRDDLRIILQLLRDLKISDTKSLQTEARVLRRDGSSVWGSVSVALVSDGHGKPQSFVVQVLDITEQKKLDEIKSQFVSTVSHELRTPLTSINGSLALVLNTMTSEMSDRTVRMLGIAQRNCERLILLVNDILDLERMTSGLMQFNYVVADIPALIRQSMEDNRPYAVSYGVSFNFNPSDEVVRCKVDINRFQQVMANLLSNAAKFSIKGESISIELSLTSHNVRVAVTNRGPGIPPAFRDRIFKPFSQVDSSTTRARDGTGLGLNIARRIVERMGGIIGFDSDPDALTTFWFTVPLAEPGHRAAPAGTDANRLNRFATPTILHVEDDRDFLDVLAMSFDQKAELIAAPDVKTARKLLASRHFDLVLLDWDLPDQNGLVLLDQLTAEAPSLPVVALTSNDKAQPDPRVAATLIKSRASFAQIVTECLSVIETSRSTTGRVDEKLSASRG